MRLPSVERPVVISVSVVFFIAILDFIFRVVVWSDSSSRPKLNEIIESPSSGESSEVILKRLSQWISIDTGVRSLVSASPDQFFLRAVFVGQQGPRAVLALSGGGNETIRHVVVEQGSEVEGWRVMKIQSRKVILSRDNSNFEIVLFKREVAAGGGVK